MSFQWISLADIPEFVEGEQLVLFGAGQGSVDFLNWLELSAPHVCVQAIADNDDSMWGRCLCGYPVISPNSLGDFEFSRIVITTISGADAVSCQLGEMGLEQGKDFCSVGKYPTNHLGNFETFFALQDHTPFLKPGAEILHVGPGGFLGFECSLYALGYAPRSTDAYSFGIAFPDVTARMAEYRAARDALLATSQGAEGKAVQERFDSLFCTQGSKVLLDKERIPYDFPVRFSSLPFADASLDVVTSFAVLEHVRSPEEAVRQCCRVLRPGGVAVHRVLSCDHRAFSKVQGYHPASYLNHSPEEWEAINTGKFYQNRVLPEEWRELFAQAGMKLELFRILRTHSLGPQECSRIHPDFAHVAAAGAVSVNCDIVARKL